MVQCPVKPGRSSGSHASVSVNRVRVTGFSVAWFVHAVIAKLRKLRTNCTLKWDDADFRTGEHRNPRVNSCELSPSIALICCKLHVTSRINLYHSSGHPWMLNSGHAVARRCISGWFIIGTCDSVSTGGFAIGEMS